MKKFLILLSLAAILIFSLNGCSDDDKVDPIKVTVENFSATIAENPSNGDVIGTITATVSGGTASYSLSAINPSGAIAINSTSGQITVADASFFDFESRQSVTATVTVTVGTQSGSGTVTITITNVLDPSVTVSPFSASIPENPENGQVIGAISASVTEGVVGYSLSNVQPSGSIGISGEGEIVVVAPEVFDYETRSSITGTIVVTSGNVSATAGITITITNVFDPVITVEDVTGNVTENAANGTLLGNIVASTTEGTLSYSLSQVTPSGAISVDQNGTITVASESAFDYESRTSVTATAVVTATGSKSENGGESEGKSNTVSKEISISIDIDNVSIPTNGLLAEYLFNGNANDGSGNGYNPTANTATLTADRFENANSAYAFNGTQYISIPNYTQLSPNTVTVSLWFASTSLLQTQRLIYVGSQSHGRQNYSLNYNVQGSRKSDFRYEPAAPLAGGTWAESTTTVTDGVWHHVVGVRDHSAKTMKIYLDGKLERTVSYSVDPVTADSPVQIGRYLTSQYYTGSIDEIRIYNRALTADEVKALFKE